MDIHIRIDAPSTGIRRLALFVGLPAALLGVTAAVAHATYDTTFVAGGQQVKAMPFKAVLDEIQSRLIKPVVTVNGKQFSIGASYCGETGTTTGAIMNGYLGAKTQCEALLACGTSLSAHMCTAEEMVRSAQANVTPMNGNGWYSTGVWEQVNGSSATNMGDCTGWTLGDSNHYGATWGSGVPIAQSCNQILPVLCCD